jgi:hypothetical protein
MANVEPISMLITRLVTSTMLPAQSLVVTYQPSQKVLAEERSTETKFLFTCSMFFREFKLELRDEKP